MPDALDSKSLSQKRFGQHAEGYVKSQSHAGGADLDRMLELAQPQADWLVLDIATGGGHTALKFARHVARVVASDLTARMLAAAERHIRAQNVANVEFKLADAEDLPFTDGRFDLVTCRIAPHHFPHVDRFLQESARVLKAGGLLVVEDHVLPENETAAAYVDGFEKLRDPSHHRAFSENEWLALVEAAGLEVLHTEHIIKRHSVQSWTQRQGVSAGVLAQLEDQLIEAPPDAAEWLMVENPRTPQASFAYHYLIIVARN